MTQLISFSKIYMQKYRCPITLVCQQDLNPGPCQGKKGSWYGYKDFTMIMFLHILVGPVSPPCGLGMTQCEEDQWHLAGHIAHTDYTPDISHSKLLLTTFRLSAAFWFLQLDLLQLAKVWLKSHLCTLPFLLFLFLANVIFDLFSFLKSAQAVDPKVNRDIPWDSENQK